MVRHDDSYTEVICGIDGLLSIEYRVPDEDMNQLEVGRMTNCMVNQ